MSVLCVFYHMDIKPHLLGGVRGKIKLWVWLKIVLVIDA